MLRATLSASRRRRTTGPYLLDAKRSFSSSCAQFGDTVLAKARRQSFLPGRAVDPTASPLASSSRAPSMDVSKHVLLQPYNLAARILKLWREGNHDGAIDMLRNSPKDAQNIKVWNTIITQAMEAQKYKTAHMLFTDLKRRGFVPNLRTYHVMMNGYVAIEKWDLFSKQIVNVHSVYEQFKTFIKDCADSEDFDKHTDGLAILHPVALYIDILGKLELYQRAFDELHELDQNGYVTPDSTIYTKLLTLISNRRHLPDGTDAASQNLSDSKYIWRRMVRALEKTNERVPPRSVEALVAVLVKGGPSDHQLLFDILHDYCGLSEPGKPRPPTKVTLSPFAYRAILNGCNLMGKYDLCLHYGQQIMDRSPMHTWYATELLYSRNALIKSGQSPDADRPLHATEALRLLQRMFENPSPLTTPNQPTLSAAFELCWRCHAWDTASQIVELATGAPVTSLEGSVVRKELVRQTPSGKPWVFHMVPKAWMNLLRAAMTSTEWQAAVRQYLEIFNRFGRRQCFADVWEAKQAVSPGGNFELTTEGAFVSLFVKAVDLALMNYAKANLAPVDKASRDTWLGMKAEAQKLSRAIKNVQNGRVRRRVRAKSEDE